MMGTTPSRAPVQNMDVANVDTSGGGVGNTVVGSGINNGGGGCGVPAESPHEALVEPWWSESGVAADDEREELVEPWWKTENRLAAAKRGESDEWQSFAPTPVGRPREDARSVNEHANSAGGPSSPLPGSQDVPFAQAPNPWWPARYPNRRAANDNIVACGGAPVGTTIEVRWPGAPGSYELDHWYAGTVIAIKSYADGQLRHTLKYKGWAEEFPGHDLAAGPKWRVLAHVYCWRKPPDAQAEPQAAAAHEQPDDQQASRPRRALRTRKAKEPMG